MISAVVVTPLPTISNPQPWATDANSTGTPMVSATASVTAMRIVSERDGDQRVEATAVAHHNALGKAHRTRFVRLHLVAVAAGGEHVHRALAHDAHDQERRLDLGGAVRLVQHHGQADDVAVALAFVDVDLAQ